MEVNTKPMPQQNSFPMQFRYVCTCGGGMKTENNLNRHIEAAQTKGTWWSIPGSHELFGVPEGTHRPLGEVAPQYGTRQSEADFQTNKAQWRAFLAARQPSQSTASTASASAIQSPDGTCIAGRNDGTRCPNKANVGLICGQHNARPGLDHVRPHASIVPALQAISGTANAVTPEPALPVQPVAPVQSDTIVLDAIKALAQSFESRFVALEQQFASSEAPAEVETVEPTPPEPAKPEPSGIAGLLSRARSNS
tara:strand:+ start:440 stop:1195 length:756 start_codon:yes stop_codon:yes gene_type:complete